MPRLLFALALLGCSSSVVPADEEMRPPAVDPQDPGAVHGPAVPVDNGLLLAGAYYIEFGVPNLPRLHLVLRSEGWWAANIEGLMYDFARAADAEDDLLVGLCTSCYPAMLGDQNVWGITGITQDDVGFRYSAQGATARVGSDGQRVPIRILEDRDAPIPTFTRERTGPLLPWEPIAVKFDEQIVRFDADGSAKLPLSVDPAVEAEARPVVRRDEMAPEAFWPLGTELSVRYAGGDQDFSGNEADPVTETFTVIGEPSLVEFPAGRLLRADDLLSWGDVTDDRVVSLEFDAGAAGIAMRVQVPRAFRRLELDVRACGTGGGDVTPWPTSVHPDGNVQSLSARVLTVDSTCAGEMIPITMVSSGSVGAVLPAGAYWLVLDPRAGRGEAIPQGTRLELGELRLGASD